MREECLDDAMLSSVIKSLPRVQQVCVPLNHPKLPRGHLQSCANPDTGRTSIFFFSDRIVSVGSPGIHHPGGECSAQRRSMATASGLGTKMPPARGQNRRACNMLFAVRAMVPRRAPS